MTTLAQRTETAPASASGPAVSGRTPRTSLWHAAATAVIWLTSLFVVALWVAGGGITATLGFNAETLNDPRAAHRTGLGQPAAVPSAPDGAHPRLRARLRTRLA